MIHSSQIEKEIIRRFRHNTKDIRVKPTGFSPKLGNLEDIRAVFFDIYGTLLISGSGDIGLTADHDKEPAFREALAAAGISHHLNESGISGSEYLLQEIEADHKKNRDLGVDYPEVEIRDIWRETLQKLKNESLIDHYENSDQLVIAAVEYESRVNPTGLMPGMLDVLSFLDKKAILKGLISNAQFFTPLLLEAQTNTTLGKLGFDSQLCFYSYEHGVSKPSLRLYELAKRALLINLQIDARQVLYIGNDMLNDIMPASRVGFRTALFEGDQRSLRLREGNPLCSNIKPDLIVTDLRHIKDCI